MAVADLLKALVSWQIASVLALTGCAALPSPRDEQGRIDPRIQSAGHLRAGAVAPVRARDPEQERKRLREHFDAVLIQLRDDTERSRELALERLERAAGRVWSARERRAWRAQLAAARQRQLELLEAYRDRGVFPVNTRSAGLVPVFVDERNTACAVGHLMRAAGWRDAVERIRRSDNLVHIDDIDGGPVLAWIATSGLTQEEAALIQPTYGPPPADAYLDEVLASGGTLDAGSVRYSDFHYSAVLIEPGLPPVATDLSDPANFGMTALGSTTIFVGADAATGIGGLASTPPLFGADGSELRVLVGFDVEPQEPGLGVSGAFLTGAPLFGGWNTALDQGLVLLTRVYSGGILVAELIADQYDSSGTLLLGMDEVSFPAVRRVRVETEAWISGEARYTYFANAFDVSICEADADCDAIADVDDLCPHHPSSNSDVDANGIGDECECGDQTEDGVVDVEDLLAINDVIFDATPAGPLCDANADDRCDVADILAANAKLFGAIAYCSRYPPPAR